MLNRLALVRRSATIHDATRTHILNRQNPGTYTLHQIKYTEPSHETDATIDADTESGNELTQILGIYTQ